MLTSGHRYVGHEPIREGNGFAGVTRPLVLAHVLLGARSPPAQNMGTDAEMHEPRGNLPGVRAQCQHSPRALLRSQSQLAGPTVRAAGSHGHGGGYPLPSSLGRGALLLPLRKHLGARPGVQMTCARVSSDAPSYGSHLTG